MPNSVQRAVSASARDGSETDREPARGNVIPCNVHDHGRTSARPFRLDRNPRLVDGDQVALDHAFRLAGLVTHVDALAAETLVVALGVQRTLRTWRRDLEVVRPSNELRVVDQRSD